MLWLAKAEAFYVLVPVNILSSFLIFFIAFLWILKKEKHKEQLFFEFLYYPEKRKEEELLELISGREKIVIQEIGKRLRELLETQHSLSMQLKDYEEYVETWAHEIKTPISLLAFLMDNRRKEFPTSVSHKLDYIQNKMQEYVNHMLYYARLKGTHKDYLFEPLSLADVCMEVLENYYPLLEEKKFQVIQKIPKIMVLSEERGLEFLLSQVISNAIKYCKPQGTPQIFLFVEQLEPFIYLHIKDNGIGVQSYDLPFLFEKGFTGDTETARKKATGMGLYLAKAIANDLKIELNVKSQWQEGFEIILQFPKL